MITGALALRNALAARVARVAGLRESSGVLGPEYEAKQVLDRAFMVWLASESDAGGRVRTDGALFVYREFSIRLAHKLNAARAAAAFEQAHADGDAVKQVILGNYADEYRECEPHTAYLGADEPEIVGGGSYLLTRLRFRTRYRFAIEPLPG